MTRMATLSLCSILATVSPVAADECDERPCFNIGTFNVKLLGNNGPANTRAEIRRLVQRIAADADLDIVVLQEINIGSSVWSRRLLPELESNGYVLAGYGEFGGSNENRQQHVVLMFRESRVDSLADVRDISIATTYDNGDCEYDSVRPPSVGRFRIRDTATELAVIGVHLKSQRPPGGVSDCDDEIRAYQAQAIVDDAIALSEADSDLVVLAVGDFNAEFLAPEFDVVREAGMQTVVPADCEPRSREGCTYLLRRYAGVIDHVVLNKDSIDELWVSTTVEESGDIDDYIDTQSDHALVWARFLVRDD